MAVLYPNLSYNTAFYIENAQYTYLLFQSTPLMDLVWKDALIFSGTLR